MNTTLKIDVSQIVSGFAKVAAIARKACEELGNALYRVARAQYAREVGRLPGSDQTARLRRKRRKLVMEWYHRRLEGA